MQGVVVVVVVVAMVVLTLVALVVGVMVGGHHVSVLDCGCGVCCCVVVWLCGCLAVYVCALLWFGSLGWLCPLTPPARTSSSLGTV
jgi:hypothetical protein